MKIRISDVRCLQHHEAIKSIRKHQILARVEEMKNALKQFAQKYTMGIMANNPMINNSSHYFYKFCYCQ